MKKYIIYGLTFLTGILSGYSLLPQKVIVERCELDHSKDYQVACVLSDICRMAIDYESESLRDGDGIHMYAGFEDLYYDTIQNLDCYGVDSLTMETFENYVWAY